MAAVGGIGRGRGLYSRLDDALQAWPVNKPVPVNSLLNYLKGRTSQDEVAYRLFPPSRDGRRSPRRRPWTRSPPDRSPRK